ncbi:MAG: DUF4065 domain-containing protein [bacterium]|nr:DUF4065 domain-containing protein [bacterium]
MKCDNCGSVETYVTEYNHNYIIKNKEINFKSKRRFCRSCNCLIYDKDLDNLASEKAIFTYNKLYGIPKEKIIKLRNSYNLSIGLFAKIIGCAKKTLISYEKGTSIPNDNYTIILNSLIHNPKIIIELIESNKSNFTDKEYFKLNTKIISNNNIDQLIFNEEFVPTVYNGYTKLDKNKVLNMILFFADDIILKTKLLKEMFYSDFIYYKNTASSITGLEYSKITYGPVPDNYENILLLYKEQNYLDLIVEYNNEYELHKIISKKKFDKNVFSKEELNTLKNIKKYFSNFTSSSIAEFSHREKAYINTKFNKKIEYDYAFDIELN